MVKDGKLILIPGKVVFTVKPPPPADGDLPVPRAPRLETEGPDRNLWQHGRPDAQDPGLVCGGSVSGGATLGFVLGVCL